MNPTIMSEKDESERVESRHSFSAYAQQFALILLVTRDRLKAVPEDLMKAKLFLNQATKIERFERPIK